MADQKDRVGQLVGDYRLLHRLGGGGFGDVYLGEHFREHTQVAVKILQARLTRHEDLKEFINEARTIRLKHPHIVSLLDFGIASDDTPFLVMTYAPNGTLRDRHPKGSQLPLSTIVSYVSSLASASQYAHNLRLVHRDVKPENMLVGPRYEVLLSDFGIVTVAHSSRSLVTEQGIGGTLPYMAPEQIAGKPRAASDQYALGIVVYEWLTGRRPFTGTAVEIAMQHTTASPPSLREQLPSLSSEVEQIVMRALAKDPKDRFDDVEAFARALEQVNRDTETPRWSAEQPSSIFPSPVQDPISTRAPAEPANVADCAVTDTTFSPLSAVSLPGVEGTASVMPSADGSFIVPIHAPIISALSGPEPPQAYHRRRLSWRIAALLLVLVLLILGSAGGLYAALNKSTANSYASFVATNGIMFGFDSQHTHTNPYEQLLNPTNVGGLTKKWVFRIGAVIHSSPAVINGVVFVGSDNGNVYALDAASGTKKWVYQTGNYVDSSPTVVNGVVYVGSGDHNVYALDSASGTKKWAYQTGDVVDSSPAVVNGLVYICSLDHNVYALNAASGTKQWIYRAGNSLISSPLVANGLVYIGPEDGNMYALDTISGTKEWAYRIGNSGIASSPTVVNGVVYVGADDYNVYAFHLPNT